MRFRAYDNNCSPGRSHAVVSHLGVSSDWRRREQDPDRIRVSNEYTSWQDGYLEHLVQRSVCRFQPLAPFLPPCQANSEGAQRKRCRASSAAVKLCWGCQIPSIERSLALVTTHRRSHFLTEGCATLIHRQSCRGLTLGPWRRSSLVCGRNRSDIYT